VICFEWLQRPENVLAGCITWQDYRPDAFPHALKIEHHKTGVQVWHPLEEETPEGVVKFYSEAEEILSHLPRRGVPMVLQHRPDGTTLPFTPVRMGKHVRKLRDELKLSSTFTLDACRHGGMTELEEAELTDGQGRALSGHRSQRAYEAMPSGRWSGLYQPPGSATPTELPPLRLSSWSRIGQPGRRLPRTRREQSFGMGRGRSFGMSLPTKVKCL
jgi:hypothetical protein